MPQTAHTPGAADLLVNGTYALRRALDRLARPRPAASELSRGERTDLDDRAARGPGRSPSPADRRPWARTRGLERLEVGPPPWRSAADGRGGA